MGRVASFFGRVFASPEAATKTLDMVRDGIDAAILTPEEKIQYTQKGVELFLKFMEQANAGPDIARRFIAILISIVWAMAVAGTFFLVLMGIWYESAALAAQVMFDVSMKLVLPSWAAVMVFYFGKGILENRAEKAD